MFYLPPGEVLPLRVELRLPVKVQKSHGNVRLKQQYNKRLKRFLDRWGSLSSSFPSFVLCAQNRSRMMCSKISTIALAGPGTLYYLRRLRLFRRTKTNRSIGSSSEQHAAVVVDALCLFLRILMCQILSEICRLRTKSKQMRCG